MDPVILLQVCMVMSNQYLSLNGVDKIDKILIEINAENPVLITLSTKYTWS